MARDTSKDTPWVWFDPIRGYIFHDTEKTPETMTPVETALMWLARANGYREMTSAEMDNIAETILPRAKREYAELKAENERLKKMVLVGRPISYDCED